jgi:exopolysaccharide biosynthesis operon protein EpsL
MWQAWGEGVGSSNRAGIIFSGLRMALGCAAAFYFPSSVRAAPLDAVPAFQPYVGYSWAYDDNVLGLPNEELAARLTGSRNMGDRSRTAQAGLLIDKTFDHQHLSGKIGLNDTKYNRFSDLNNQGQDISLAWNWHIGLHLDGDLTTSYVRSLTPFMDFHQFERNLRTQRATAFDVRWRFHPSWRVDTAAGTSATDYSLLSQQANDRRYRYAETGTDYLAQSGSTFGLVVRHGQGEYRVPVQISNAAHSNDFKQNELKARINWLLSGQTRLEFLGGAVSRTHESLGYRDYRGFNARTSVTWNASGKSTLAASLYREIGATDDITALYALVKGASLTGTMVVSEKVSTQLQVSRERRQFRRVAEFAQAPQYSDSVRIIGWTVNYSPVEKLLLRGTIYHDAKTANLADLGFTRKGGSVSAEYRF